MKKKSNTIRPLLSVIVPVYNSEKYLNKLIESIINQSYDNYELIMINDGSTDNSISIIEKYASKYSNIKFKTIVNSGPGNARKIGYEISRGDLLFFVDSDDLLPDKNIFQTIADCYYKTGFEILFFDFQRLANNEVKIHNTFFNRTLKKGSYNIDYLDNKPVASALWCKIFVRNKMKKEFFIDYNNYEDCYLTYKYLNECSSFYYLDTVLYFANRDNPNSLSKIQDYSKVEKTFILLEDLYKNVRFKRSIMMIILDYYIGIRRLIDIKKYSEIEKQKILLLLLNYKNKLKLNNHFYKEKNIKFIIKYIHYSLMDIRFRSKDE